MRFSRFLGVGGAATALHYVLLMILVEVAALSAVVATSIGYVISAVFNYTLNYHFTFASSEKHKVAATKFAIVAGTGLSINSLIVYILASLGFHYIVAQIAATAVVTLFNFFTHKYWTYKAA